MSKYTTQLRWVIERGQDEEQSPFDKIKNGYHQLFDFDYPFYVNDDKIKAEFEQQFCKHYYMKEIGCETVGLFKLFLASRLQDNYPLYKQLYESSLLIIDPLHTLDIKEIYSGTETQDNNIEISGNETQNNKQNSSSTSNSNSNDSNNTKEINSNFPQASYTTGSDYATSGSDKESENTTQNTATNSEEIKTNAEKQTNQETKQDNEKKNEYDKNTSGFNGNQSDLLLKYRETFLNINLQIIEDCKDLFMTIY